MSEPIIIHVPHASTTVPVDVRDQFLLTDDELDVELGLITDHFTDELFHYPESLATTIQFPVSRIVLDPERFVDDEDEPMSKRGMGVVYTLTTQQTPLRRDLFPDERRRLIDEYYSPHHRRLTEAVNKSLKAHGKCTIIDAHSFPSVPLPYELDQELDRPDFCIGTNPYHTPSELEEIACGVFSAAGYSVELNRPFAGSLVPLEHYQKDPRVSSVMIEVNRGLYLDPPTRGSKSTRFDEIQTVVQECVSRILSTS